MDEFDNTINLEEITYQEAKQDGVKDGLKLGYVEGYQLGHEKGTELGQEIGYYHSCVQVWNHLVEQFKDSHKFSTRGLTNLEKLTKLLNEFHLDLTNDEIMNSLSDIRIKFKLTSSQLSLQTKEHTEMSF
ncbi:DUF1715 family protein [Cavenderia fasciculata]|uniref:DUF1715 family protein n=1 Tax=Cavenderia fasciculata TaxID=261658 RepID=F4Q4M6_CACFS|nr:DUF1715 family protein [Cavenderia fasciculata]EGG17035.1 DUF1715 family protein [Cavenderia fasciculata]|eukprot:XP_004355519.1 DUF1715 family protein [Cavenderia fasciculata]